MKKVIVVQKFRDKIDHKTWYNPGDELEGFSEERIANLVAKSWVRIEETRTEFGPLNLADTAAKIEETVKDMEDADLLKDAAAAELNGKARANVQKILETRIQKIEDEEEAAIKAVNALAELPAVKDAMEQEKTRSFPRPAVITAIQERAFSLM